MSSMKKVGTWFPKLGSFGRTSDKALSVDGLHLIEITQEKVAVHRDFCPNADFSDDIEAVMVVLRPHMAEVEQVGPNGEEETIVSSYAYMIPVTEFKTLVYEWDELEQFKSVPQTSLNGDYIHTEKSWRFGSISRKCAIALAKHCRSKESLAEQVDNESFEDWSENFKRFDKNIERKMKKQA